MKNLLLVSIVAALALAGCATTDQSQYAKADCKVKPITTLSATGVRPNNPDSKEQSFAEMDLATSQYRRQQYALHGPVPNNVEEALRDCY